MAAALQPQPPPLTPQAKPTAPAAAPTPPAAANDKSKDTEQVTVHAPKPFSIEEMNQQFQDYTQKKQDIADKRGNLKPPEFKAPKEPTPQKTDAVEAWGSAAMAMAVIGSFFTRTPLTTALNSAAGVMKAIKANDIETAKEQYDNWKIAYDEYNKAYNYQVELYKSAISQSERDEKSADATFLAYTRAMGDDTARLAYEQNGKLGWERLNVARQHLHDNQVRDGAKMITSAEFVKAWSDPVFQAKYQAEKDPQVRMGMIAELQSGLSQDELDFFAKQRLAGDVTATQNFRGPQGQAALAAIRTRTVKIAKELNMGGADLAAADARFSGLKAAEAAAGRRFVPIAAAVKEIERLTPLVQQSSKGVDRGKWMTLNALINAGRAETSDPKLRAFALNLQAYKNAYAQMLKRGGAATDAANAKSDELFSQNDPNNVINVVMDQAALEGYGTMGAMQDAEIGLRALFGSGTNKGPFLITTQEQWDAMPEGSVYFETDGTKYTKPVTTK